MAWLQRAGRLRLFLLIRFAVLLAPLASLAQQVQFTENEKHWIATHPVVRIAVNPYLQPLEYLQNGTYKGLTADYLDAIGRISGLRFNVLPVPPDRVSDALRAGEIDLLPAVSPIFTATEMRRQLILSTPYFVGGTVIVTRGYGKIIFDPRKLQGLTVALRGGGMYEQILRRNYPAIRLLLVATPDEALAAVNEERADAAIDIDSIFLPIMYRRYPNQLHVSGTIADLPATISIGVRSSQPELAGIIEKSLTALTARQTDAIVERWLARVSYGPPTLAQILYHRWFEAIMIAGTLLLLLFAAYHARRARRAAEHSEQDKARFLAVMSHEIRTPMNAILASIELLARSKLSQRQRQLSDLATTSSEALLELLDDVLDWSQMKARRLTLTKVPVDMQQLARGVIDIARSAARKKNLEIKLHCALPAAAAIIIDPARVRQILINLTSNAVKFTECGLVQVIVALERDGIALPPDSVVVPASASLLLIVSDTGTGVPLERQQDLFRPYHQAHQTSTRRFGGTGLGLAICRELCDLMQGSICFNSSADVGTRVTCRIPVELVSVQAQSAAPEAALSRSEPPPGASDSATTGGRAPRPAPHILVVEDHPGNRKMLRQQLKELGYRYTIANDGRSALAQTARRSFSLMLLDCYLPDIDGYTVASEQRAREAGCTHLPIIAISAAADQTHLDACIRSGMDGMLRKPLRLAALDKLLRAWCGPGQVASAAEAAVPGTVDNKSAINDPDDVLRHSMCIDLDKLIAALDQADTDLAKRILHRMVGAALVCRWSDMAAAVCEIDRELQGAARPDALAGAIEHIRQICKKSPDRLAKPTIGYSADAHATVFVG